MPLVLKRATEFFGMMIIGDSIAAVAYPRQHVALWSDGPRAWRRIMQPFLRHPSLTRALGGVGLLAGLWLVGRQRV